MRSATQVSWLEAFRKQVPHLSFADKTLPCQPVLRLNFDGDDQAFHAALYEVLVNASGLRSPVEEFDLKESDDVTIAEMASVPMALRFLELLVLLTQPRRILEIGTFLGISAMTMARALPPKGHVTTLEVSPRFAALARENVRRNHLEHAITLIEGNALEALRAFDPAKPFDLIFLDADKDHYSAYFQLLDALLAGGGLLIIDDVLFHGDVLNEVPKTSKGVGVKALLKLAQAQSHYRSVLLPLSTGMMLMVKQGQRRHAEKANEYKASQSHCAGGTAAAPPRARHSAAAPMAAAADAESAAAASPCRDAALPRAARSVAAGRPGCAMTGPAREDME